MCYKKIKNENENFNYFKKVKRINLIKINKKPKL